MKNLLKQMLLVSTLIGAGTCQAGIGDDIEDFARDYTYCSDLKALVSAARAGNIDIRQEHLCNDYAHNILECLLFCQAKNILPHVTAHHEKFLRLLNRLIDQGATLNPSDPRVQNIRKILPKEMEHTPILARRILDMLTYRRLID